MRKGILVIMTFLACVNLNAKAQKNFIDQNYIEVKGNAKMEVVPNEIYLNIVLNEKDTKNKKSIEELEQQMFIALKKAGVNLEKQLSVSDFASNLKFYFIKKPNVLKSKYFELLVHDSESLAKVFVELEKIKVSNIDIKRVSHSDIEKLRQQVKINAVKAGKQKAEALSSAIGQKIGKAIYISESFNRYNYDKTNANFRIRGMSVMNDEVKPKLDFQKIKLESTVLMRFEIE